MPLSNQAEHFVFDWIKRLNEGTCYCLRCSSGAQKAINIASRIEAEPLIIIAVAEFQKSATIPRKMLPNGDVPIEKV